LVGKGLLKELEFFFKKELVKEGIWQGKGFGKKGVILLKLETLGGT